MASRLYFLGASLVAVGLIIAASLLHVPGKWIAVFTIILIGVAILKTAKNTRGGSGN
jgi:uncharacterized membrane protein YiaA